MKNLKEEIRTILICLVENYKEVKEGEGERYFDEGADKIISLIEAEKKKTWQEALLSKEEN